MAPHGVELTGREAGTAAVEKRAMAPKPDSRLIFESFPQYAREFENFYNDSFGLRHDLIRWNNRLRLLLFNESAVRGVRVGREGWLFYANEWVLEDCEHMIPFKPEELQKIRKNVEARAAWLQQKGIKLFILAVPEKSTIYPEYLPPVIHKVGRKSRLDQVMASLADCPGVTLVDSREALLKAKPMQRLYHRTDSHWNDYGAFIAYGELMNHVAVQFPGLGKRTLDDYTVSVAEGVGGDLAGMLSLSDVIPEERITLSPRFTSRAVNGVRVYKDPVDLKEYPGRDMVVKETHDRTLPKALVFRDSFSWALIPFVAESFQSTVFVWTFDFSRELVENEKPDIVVIECVERYLNSLTKEDV
jgi:alginate O-acetyltransferase complex protein AlgJ